MPFISRDCGNSFKQPHDLFLTELKLINYVLSDALWCMQWGAITADDESDMSDARDEDMPLAPLAPTPHPTPVSLATLAPRPPLH